MECTPREQRGFENRHERERERERERDREGGREREREREREMKREREREREREAGDSTSTLAEPVALQWRSNPSGKRWQERLTLFSLLYYSQA